MSNRLAVAAAVMFSVSAFSPAYAGDGDPIPYISLGAGVHWPQSIDVNGAGVDSEVDMDKGATFRAAVGIDYDSPLRSELELSHYTSDLDTVDGADASGDIDVTGLMANVYWDFLSDSPYTPYIGAGIGGFQIDANGNNPIGGSTVDDDDFALGYQGIIGVSRHINEQWSLTADYRYFTLNQVNMRSQAGTDLASDFETHALMFGLRYDFGVPKKPVQAEPVVEPAVVVQPEPEPEPVAAPEPVQVPRTYLVFFDWDRSDLTPAALEIVRDAAANAQAGGISVITATGHADRSGTDTYNDKLSQRRAETVKAQLVAFGVTGSSISTDWKGERQPLVPTDDGIREPQNRRVEIVFP